MNDLLESLNEINVDEQNSKLNYELNLEYSQISKEDQQILQETHFSKDDLQDPETIKKLEEKLKKKEPIFATLGALTGCLLFVLSAIGAAIAGTGTVVLMIIGFPAIIGICITVGMVIYNIPRSQFEKDYKKFKDKVQKLKDKSQEKMDQEKDSSKKSEYKKIITNCDKVLKIIEKREKEIADKKFKEDVNELTNYYKGALNMFENPHMLSLDNQYYANIEFTILSKIGCDYSLFLNNCKKAKWSRAQVYISFDNLVDYLDSSEVTKESIHNNSKFNIVPEFKNNDKIAVCVECGDTDWIDGYVTYSEKANKFFFISFDGNDINQM